MHLDPSLITNWIFIEQLSNSKLWLDEAATVGIGT